MENITIQKVTINQIAQLQEIGRHTFYETFAKSNSENDMQKYLNESFSNIKLATELSDPNTEFYFAISNNEVVGYFNVNFGTS